MPKEVTKEGRFYSHLEDFLYNQAIADDIEDVLNHCVWKSEGKMYFQLSSLERYLRKIQFKDFSTTQMGSMIRDKGGDSKLHRVNKNTTKNTKTNAKMSTKQITNIKLIKQVRFPCAVCPQGPSFLQKVRSYVFC